MIIYERQRGEEEITYNNYFRLDLCSHSRLRRIKTKGKSTMQIGERDIARQEGEKGEYHLQLVLCYNQI